MVLYGDNPRIMLLVEFLTLRSRGRILNEGVFDRDLPCDIASFLYASSAAPPSEVLTKICNYICA